MKNIAIVREDFLCIVRQWMPQSCRWEEVVEGHYPTFDAARLRAVELNKTNFEAFVKNRPAAPAEGER